MGKLWSKLVSILGGNVLKDKVPNWLFYKDQVDKCNINIALVGSSQSGKSSFINTMIG